MVKGNDYNEQVSKLNFSDFRSSYIIEFQNAKTTSDAKKIFNELKDDLYIKPQFLFILIHMIILKN